MTLSSEKHVKHDSTQHILAIGEYVKLPFNDDSSYAVSNKEVLTVKTRANKKTIILRAKHLGQSDVTVWKGQNRENTSVIVLNKSSVNRLRNDLRALKASEIESVIENGEITIQSILNSLEQLKILGKIYEQRKDKAIKVGPTLKLTIDLKKELTNYIYSKLISSGHEPIECNYEFLPVKCVISKSSLSIKSFDDYWFENLPIKLVKQDRRFHQRNYRIKAKIVLLEAASAEQISLGLDQLGSSVENLLDKNFESLINNNELQFNNIEAEISSIATPEIILRPNEQGEISIGSEIPFSNRKQDEIYTDWKFAGLKLLSKIEKASDFLTLSISSELSRPNAGEVTTITTNKFKTKIKLQLNKTIKLSELFHKGIQVENTSIAYLSKIPVLGKLFSKNSETETNKHISIYIKVVGEK